MTAIDETIMCPDVVSIVDRAHDINGSAIPWSHGDLAVARQPVALQIVGDHSAGVPTPYSVRAGAH